MAITNIPTGFAIEILITIACVIRTGIALIIYFQTFNILVNAQN